MLGNRPSLSLIGRKRQHLVNGIFSFTVALCLESIFGKKLLLSEAMPKDGMQAEQELRPPLDISHHFSLVTKARKESSIKDFYKYFAIPGIGNLAGGE